MANKDAPANKGKPTTGGSDKATVEQEKTRHGKAITEQRENPGKDGRES